MNRTSAIVLPDGSRVSYTYDGNGNPTVIRKADGSQEERSYDSRSRLVRVASGQKELASYRYDAAGNVNSSREAYGEEPLSADYMYDIKGRLCVVLGGDSRDAKTSVYHYDSLGNMVEEVCSEGGRTSRISYRYNNLNQLIQKGGVHYEYDGRRNLVREVDGQGNERAAYTYDGTNRMVYARTAQGESSYGYNALGQVTSHNGTEYVPDPLTETGRPLASIGEGTGVYWTYGPEGRNTARIGEEVYSVTLDRLGSSRVIREESGREAAVFAYDVWGRPEVIRTAPEYAGTELSIPNYTGHAYDENLGQYHAKARMYAPELKKFTALDPSRAGLNWTEYCVNNPLKYVDPNGEYAEAIRWQEVQSVANQGLELGKLIGSFDGPGPGVADMAGTLAAIPYLAYAGAGVLYNGGVYVYNKVSGYFTKSKTQEKEQTTEGYMEPAGCTDDVEAGDKDKGDEESKGESETVTNNQGKEIDITPDKNHTTTSKNSGYKGEPNSSVDILDKDGNVVTRRWFDENGNAIRDVDMTNHGNPKQHPEWPHEHFWEYGPDGKPTSR